MTGHYRFLDVYRGLIVVFMVQGHVMRELIVSSARTTEIFRLHELFHGIIGPGFLFGAGLTFGISAQRRWNDYLHWTPVLRRRLTRIVMILAIGYGLHLPFFSLRKILAETSIQGWNTLISFDALQCIGFSLLLLQVLVVLIRRERVFPAALSILLLLAVYSAPVISSMVYLPAFLLPALGFSTGSIYPLVPYGGFVFAGALVSYGFMRMDDTGGERQFIARLAVAGIALPAAGWILDILPASTFGEYDFWLASPNFFLMKLGGICLMISGAWSINRMMSGRFPRTIQWLTIVGVESLFVYVTHLLMLYGSVLNPEVHPSAWWGGSLKALDAALLTIASILVLILLARLWNFMKTRHEHLVRLAIRALAGATVLEFLTRPY